MDNKVILQAAWKELADKDTDIEEAETLIRIMRTAGEDVTKEVSDLAQLKARRNKLMLALEQEGGKPT